METIMEIDISKSEAILLEKVSLLVTTGADTAIGVVNNLKVTSRHLIFTFNNLSFSVKYSDLFFHALNKEKKYVMLHINPEAIKEYLILQDDKLFISTEEASELFEAISTGSSLNPDEEKINDHLEIENPGNFLVRHEDNEDDDEENIEEEDDVMINPEDEIDRTNKENFSLNYEAYNYSNSIEKIFKMEKVQKDLSDNDPRRFEDADV